MRNLVSIAFMFVMMLMTSTVFAQSYTFRVIANKGDNQVKKAGATSAIALKTGSTLNSGDELIVSEGAYIGLMHSSGKTTEVRSSGTKKVSDLEKKVNVGSTSIATRYARFVASKMSEEENTNNRSRSYATGAISRDVVNAAIKILLPGTQVEFIGDNAIIRWGEPEAGMEEGDVYLVTIKDIFDEVIYTTETANESIELDFTDSQLKNEAGLYIFNVMKKGNEEVKSIDFGVKRLENPEVKEGLASLKNEVTDDSPLNKLIYASFYEENGLLLDALTKYEEAIQLAPDIQDFQDLYDNFKLKNGLVTDAE